MLREFMDGFLEAQAEHGTILSGGDTVRAGDKAMFSVTVVGEVPKQRLLLRSGARPGDDLWVSGFLGSAAAGLELCRRQDAWDVPEAQVIRSAHLDPVARMDLGQQLARSGLAHAMLDMSDGLATDLGHLCAASGVGAEIDAGCLPISPAAKAYAGRIKASALEWALFGGEDYQLLVAAPVEARERLVSLGSAANRLWRVGRIVTGQGVTLAGDGPSRRIDFGGYDHFARGDGV
jgi:thiamine-monophosphate kinase